MEREGEVKMREKARIRGCEPILLGVSANTTQRSKAERKESQVGLRGTFVLASSAVSSFFKDEHSANYLGG